MTYILVYLLLLALAAVLVKKGIDKSNFREAAALFTTVIALLLTVKSYSLSEFAGLKNLTAFGGLFIVGAAIAIGSAIFSIFASISLGDIVLIFPVYSLYWVLEKTFDIVLLKDDYTREELVIMGLALLGVIIISINLEKKKKNYAYLGYAFLAAFFACMANVIMSYRPFETGESLSMTILAVLAAVFLWMMAFASSKGKGLKGMDFVCGMTFVLAAVVLVAGLIIVNNKIEFYEDRYFSLLYEAGFAGVIIAGPAILKEKVGVRIIVGYLLIAISLYFKFIGDIPFISI